MQKLKTANITDWLIVINALSIIHFNERNYRIPTEIGTSIGISVERRTGMYGEYTINLYNNATQNFIIDNFESILDFMRTNSKSKSNKKYFFLPLKIFSSQCF